MQTMSVSNDHEGEHDEQGGDVLQDDDHAKYKGCQAGSSMHPFSHITSDDRHTIKLYIVFSLHEPRRVTPLRQSLSVYLYVHGHRNPTLLFTNNSARDQRMEQRKQTPYGPMYLHLMVIDSICAQGY